MNDHARRDCFEIGAYATFAFEARAELGLRQVLRNAGNDAARESDAAARPKQEHEITSHGAQHRTKHVEGRFAHRAGAGQRGPCDLGGTSVWNSGAIKLGNRAVEILQTRARQRAFG